jgi:hypothetical protein
MSPLKKRDLKTALTKKLGFQRRGGSKHEIFVLPYKDKGEIRTAISRGRASEDISDNLVGRMARDQLHISTGHLKGIVGCQKSLKDYLQAIELQEDSLF